MLQVKRGMIKKNSRGTILIENVVFILLNIMFIAILVVFLLKQGSGIIVLEQSYAKKTALLIDYAKPEMIIKLDMEKAKKLSEKNGIDFSKVMSVSGNVVKVKLSDKSGYTYSFFNDVDATVYADTNNYNEYTGTYVITITRKISGGEE